LRQEFVGSQFYFCFFSQQVTNKVVFPKEPKVSLMCKSLINKVLAPLKARIRIPGIKTDPWYVYNTNDSGHGSRERNVSNFMTGDVSLLNIKYF
jgi:hypothetical protein